MRTTLRSCLPRRIFKRRDGKAFQLTRLFHSWWAAADEGNYVGAVFFDIRKAFDTVWHDALVMKLRAAGLHDRTLKWLTSFLSDGTKSTLVEGYNSQPAPLHGGVPQGAILSPLLFSIYVNDMPSDGSTNLFADDTSSYFISPSSSLLSSRLQERVDSLNSWFQTWRLSIQCQ